MRTSGSRTAAAIVLLGGALSVAPVSADDWPQWNGPNRDGRLHETAIVKTVPSAGLPQLWQQSLGLGYSGPAVVAGRIFVTDYVKRSGSIANNPGKRDQLKGTERILCLDADSGKVLWVHEYERPYAVSYGSGPRATPTVHDGRVYALGAEGNLICLDVSDGRVLWQKDFAGDYDAKTPLWGHSAAPLVYQDTLICLVGGADDRLVVAFDLATGEERWHALSAPETGYCPPAVITAGGTQQLLIWEPNALHSIHPEDGREFWKQSLKPGYGMSILPPVQEGDLLFASGAGSVSAMYRLAERQPDVEVEWRGNPRNSVYLATAGAIFEDGYLYGSDTRTGTLVCARAEDGERMWQTTRPTSGGDRKRGPAHGSAFLIRTPHGYLILSDSGDLISAQLTPQRYQETGRFHAIDPTEQIGQRKVVWTFPAVSEGRLYLRSGEQMVCYDVRD